MRNVEKRTQVKMEKDFNRIAHRQETVFSLAVVAHKNIKKMCETNAINDKSKMILFSMRSSFRFGQAELCGQFDCIN